MNSVMSAAAASQSANDAVGRNPHASPTPTTTIMATRLRAVDATTWPKMIVPRGTGIVRNRSTIPSRMSRATLTAVDEAPKLAASSMMPGTT